MAAQWKHKRYFKLMGSDSSLVTFSSVADAKTKIGFTSVFDTSSPTKTEAKQGQREIELFKTTRIDRVQPSGERRLLSRSQYMNFRRSQVRYVSARLGMRLAA